MSTQKPPKNKGFSAKLVYLAVIFCFAFKAGAAPLPQTAAYGLPCPNQFVPLSKAYSYPVLKGIKINPENPFKLEFIIDAENKEGIDKEELSYLVKYFLAALTIPEKELWVNLSPYEKNRIIPENLGLTDLGKDMLGQDYILKQLVSSITHPESKSGKKYWGKIYEKINKITGNSKIPIDTFNKVWIIPESAEVYENGNVALITEAKLKAMMEEDMQNAKGIEHSEKSIEHSAERIAKETKDSSQPYTLSPMPSAHTRSAQRVAHETMRQVILPEIEKDINYGENFAKLRQMYYSLILAVWFKKKLKDSIYQYYINQGKIQGIDLKDKDVKENIYNLYAESFKKGVYDYIKTEKTTEGSPERSRRRRYCSGGIEFGPYFSGTKNVAKYTSSSIKLDKNIFTCGLIDLNPIAPSEEIASSSMKKITDMLVPPGWTYLYHNSNLTKKEWDKQSPFNGLILTAGDKGLPVAPVEAIRPDAPGEDYTDTIRGSSYPVERKDLTPEEYASRKKPFRICVLFPEVSKTVKDYLTSQGKPSWLKRTLTSNKKLFQRQHPPLPAGTRLTKLAHVEDEGFFYFYYIPVDMIKDYMKTLLNNSNELSASIPSHISPNSNDIDIFTALNPLVEKIKIIEEANQAIREAEAYRRSPSPGHWASLEKLRKAAELLTSAKSHMSDEEFLKKKIKISTLLNQYLDKYKWTENIKTYTEALISRLLDNSDKKEKTAKEVTYVAKNIEINTEIWNVIKVRNDDDGIPEEVYIFTSGWRGGEITAGIHKIKIAPSPDGPAGPFEVSPDGKNIYANERALNAALNLIPGKDKFKTAYSLFIAALTKAVGLQGGLSEIEAEQAGELAKKTYASSSIENNVLDTANKGGIDWSPDNINLKTAGSSIQFNLPPETIQKFQASSGLTFEVVEIREKVDIDKLLQD